MKFRILNLYLVFLLRKLLQINKENISDSRKLALFQRQIQQLSIQYRLNHSMFQLGCAIPCLIAIQMACLNNSIVLFSGKDTGGPIWYNLLYVWCEFMVFLMIVFVFGILADVHNVSIEVHKKINGRLELKRNKWFKRWIKSCPVLKIYFWESNFMDRLTPLNIQSFAVTQTVNLML